MSIKTMPCVSITCDGCGYGYDEMHTTPVQEIEVLKRLGWTGTYKKCFCPECSKKNNDKQIVKSCQKRNS